MPISETPAIPSETWTASPGAPRRESSLANQQVLKVQGWGFKPSSTRGASAAKALPRAGIRCRRARCRRSAQVRQSVSRTPCRRRVFSPEAWPAWYRRKQNASRLSDLIQHAEHRQARSCPHRRLVRRLRAHTARHRLALRGLSSSLTCCVDKGAEVRKREEIRPGPRANYFSAPPRPAELFACNHEL